MPIISTQFHSECVPAAYSPQYFVSRRMCDRGRDSSNQ